MRRITNEIVEGSVIHLALQWCYNCYPFSYRSNGDIQIPSHDRVSSVEPPLMDQPHIIPHVGLFRVSSAGRDKTRSQHRTSPESSAGIKSFTRYNLNFNPVNASKPPMPPQSLNNNRSSSSETRRPRAKLDRTQRSSVSWYLQL